MKVRNGFVSNSSSSSFMIAYRNASVDEIDDPKVLIKGGYASEGECLFRPDKDMIDYIKSNGKGDYDIIYEYFSVDEIKKISKKELLNIVNSIPDNVEIILKAFKIDQNQPESLDDFLKYVDRRELEFENQYK